MNRWIKYFFDICLLRAGPQDAPSSKSAMQLTVFFYWATGTALISLNQSPMAAVLIALIQTILGVFFINLALWIRKFPERYAQTLTAFAGSGIIISLVAFPVLAWLSQVGDAYQWLYSVFWLSLVIWETVIVATIFKNALEIPMVASTGVALILMFMSFAITLRFLKLMSVQLG